MGGDLCDQSFCKESYTPYFGTICAGKQSLYCLDLAAYQCKEEAPPCMTVVEVNPCKFSAVADGKACGIGLTCKSGQCVLP